MLLVKPYCAYLTSVDEKWRPEDYGARFYTLMVKGKRDKLKANHFCKRPKNTGWGVQTFKNNAQDVAAIRQHFGGWAAKYLKASGEKRVSLIPVPNSNATPNMTGAYATQEIAEAIAKEFGAGAEVIDKLRFKKPMLSASTQGGSRDRLTIASAMFMPSGSKPNGTPILIDDVLTSGAHLLAARTVLKGRGIVVEDAIVCGRTFSHQVDDPFDIPEEDLDDAFFGVLASV